MKQYRTTSSAGDVWVLVAGATFSAGPIAQTWGAPPDQIELTGTVRDFRRSHPDFDTVPTGGPGHYAGNVAFTLGTDPRPAFTGEGFRVDFEWQDEASRPIAPHLFGGWGAGAVLVASAPSISVSATLDTWDSSVGPYGGANTGPAPNVVVGATMPTITPPTGMGSSVGNVLYQGSGTSVLSGNLHCDSLAMRDQHTLQIDGSVTILCDGSFDMRDGAAIELLPGASVEIYVLGDVRIQDSTINDGFYEPSRFVIYHLGIGVVRIDDEAQVYGTVVSPNGTVSVEDTSNLYGAVIATDLDVTDTAALHIDAKSPFDQCGNRINDSVGAAGVSSTGGITSAASFDQWFRDVIGVNMSIRNAITLVRGEDGVFEFFTDSFLPLDDRLVGNEGKVHNYYFTYVIDSWFVYGACAGQFIEFEGNDDAWIFIDGKLAIDLGGISPGTAQHADLDRLGLVDGELYPLVLFYAQRQAGPGSFGIRTNVPLSTTDVPYAISAMFD